MRNEILHVIPFKGCKTELSVRILFTLSAYMKNEFWENVEVESNSHWLISMKNLRRDGTRVILPTVLLKMWPWNKNLQILRRNINLALRIYYSIIPVVVGKIFNNGSWCETSDKWQCSVFSILIVAISHNTINMNNFLLYFIFM